MTYRYNLHRLLLTALLIMGSMTIAQAQKKKDLISEIDALETQLTQTRAELASARNKEASANAKVTAIEAELADLRQTNANLLNNLNRITEESSKKTASISESLTNIQRTERQLRTISDALTRIDSTTLSIVTSLKKTMGENAKIGISNNVVTIAIENAVLFGEDDHSFQLTEPATTELTKMADILNKHADLKLLVESHANSLDFQKGAPADNLELSALRAVAVSRKMSGSLGIKQDRIAAVGKGVEGLSIETTTRFHFRPNYEAFFKSLKDNIKN